MIGVFDSGFGGLTVHRALIEALPGRDFVYLGDNRNAPYGVRPPIDVLNLTCAALERLFAEGCTLAVLACNTASTVALRWMQQQWLPVRLRDDGVARNVIGIVVPTIEAATEVAWHEGDALVQQTRQSRIIAVFATRRTVEDRLLPHRNPQAPARSHRVVQQACPELSRLHRAWAAPLCSAGVGRTLSVSELLLEQAHHRARMLSSSAGTHYPLVADLFAAALPPGVRMIHQPNATARALKSIFGPSLPGI